MSAIRIWLLLLSPTLLFSHAAWSQTVYIKDELYVPLRSGPSSQHRILHKGLKTSTSLSVLGKNDDESWVNVRTTRGLEGWIPSQYILAKPTAAIELTSTRKKLEILSKQYAELSNKYKTASSELSKTKKNLRSTESAQQKANMELHRIKSISSGAIELDQKYQALLEEHEVLQTVNDTLNAENESLKADQRFSYMFYGAILIIIGMFMAVIIPRFKIKKRHSEWAN